MIVVTSFLEIITGVTVVWKIVGNAIKTHLFVIKKQ